MILDPSKAQLHLKWLSLFQWQKDWIDKLECLLLACVWLYICCFIIQAWLLIILNWNKFLNIPIIIVPWWMWPKGISNQNPLCIKCLRFAFFKTCCFSSYQSSMENSKRDHGVVGYCIILNFLVGNDKMVFNPCPLSLKIRYLRYRIGISH